MFDPGEAGPILIVDDEPANTQLLKKLLSGAGYGHITITNDSTEAAGLYADLRPDLVILDITMPVLDGLDVLRQFAAIEKNNWLPVLIVSGRFDEETIFESLSLGARDFVSKPFSRVEIMMRAGNVIEVRASQRRLRDFNASLEEAVRERTRELSESHMDVIRRLGRCAQYRDDETGNHVLRMSLYCERLARALGFDEAKASVLREASTMHDLGKIGVPDAILKKPGRLTEEEREVMKAHTLIGANLLAGGRSPLLQLAESIAMSHHEWWNGAGYPQGTRGEDIPLEARICGICDVFDALTSLRPYKEPWPEDMAVAEVRRLMGEQFDPVVTRAFLTITPEIFEIRARYKDRVLPK